MSGLVGSLAKARALTSAVAQENQKTALDPPLVKPFDGLSRPRAILSASCMDRKPSAVLRDTQTVEYCQKKLVKFPRSLLVLIEGVRALIPSC